MDDHDQRFKSLLKEFLPDFFRLFLPDWADRFDFSRIEWLEQEVFPDPPEGRRRQLDLVAKLSTREPVGGQPSDQSKTWVSLIHTEIDSSESSQPVRQYLFRAWANLRDKYELPVLPVAVFLRVGLDGIGIGEYGENFGPLDVLRFKFLYVGLAALDAVEYVERDIPLGVALSPLMKVPPDRRAWLKAEALERLARSAYSEQLRYLLSECVETYLPLKDAEQEEFERLIATEEYREAKTMAVTYFEKGMEQGREQGLQQGRREVIRVQLEDRFGPLSAEARERLEQWPADSLDDLARRVLRAGSLRELGLEGMEGEETA